MTQLAIGRQIWAYVRRKWRPAIVIKTTSGHNGFDWYPADGDMVVIPAKQPKVTVRLMRGQIEYTVSNTRRFIQTERPMRQTELNLWGVDDDE